MDSRNDPIQKVNSSSLYLAFLPIPLFIVTIVVLHLVSFTHPLTQLVFEPPLLLPILNTVCLFIVGCIVSYIAMSAYLLAGSATTLLLGCGVLTLGTGALLAGWLIGPGGPNATATVFNTTALVASVFHVIAAIVDFSGRQPETDQNRRQIKLGLSYGSVVVFVIVLAILSHAEIIPLFFVQGKGPTTLRQAVLATALVFYVIASSYMMRRFIQKRVTFFFWYSVALALVAINMAGTYFQPAVGSILGWISRFAVYTAGIYFLTAMISTSRESRKQKIPLDETVAELFRKSEQKISSILASITDCHFELDREWRFVRVNDHAVAYFGRKRDELIGRSYFEVFPSLKGSILHDQYVKAISNAISVHFDVQSVLYPGKWIELHVYPTEEKGVSVFFRDITDRKQEQAALEKMRDILTEGQMIAHMGTFEYIVDTRTTVWSEEEYRIYGLDPAGLSPTYDVMLARCIHPDDADLLHQTFTAAMQNRSVYELEHRIVHPDGSVHWVYDRAQPHLDQDGNLERYVGATLDITAHKKLEEELSKRQVELQSLFNNSNAGLVLFEAKPPYAVLAHNRYYQELFAEPFKTHGMAGKSIYEYAPEVEAQGVVAVFNEVLRTGKAVDLLDFSYDSNPPERSWFNWHLSPVIHDGEVVALASMSINVTIQHLAEEALRKAHDQLELRVQERTAELIQAYDKLMEETKEREKLQDQLRQSQKMEAIGTLAGGIAHDFNNILAAIIGFSEMVEEDLPQDNPSLKHVQRVLSAASRGRDLVKQILAFSRKAEPMRKPLSLAPIIEETIQLLRASLPSTINITLSMKAAQDTLVASPTEIQQILMNLATNASFAMGEKGGTLGIHVANIALEPDLSVLDENVEQGEYIQLTVTDTGVGMTADVMKRAFDPFFTTKEVGKGTGMGLAVVYGIVKSLGGTIVTESDPGTGSTFRIFLPVAPTDKKSEEGREQIIPSGTEHILFVDDEELLMEWGQAALERLGYTVTALTDSTEALKLFSSDPSRFDLVITDQTMPKLTGLTLSQKLQAIRANIPIILCTGHSDSVTPEKAKEAGIKEFLLKPLGKQQLAEVVRRVLNTTEHKD